MLKLRYDNEKLENRRRYWEQLVGIKSNNIWFEFAKNQGTILSKHI